MAYSAAKWYFTITIPLLGTGGQQHLCSKQNHPKEHRPPHVAVAATCAIILATGDAAEGCICW